MSKQSLYPREVNLGSSAPRPTSHALDGIVAELRDSRDVTHNIRRGGRIRKMPSRAILDTVVEQLIIALFPTHYGSLDFGGDGVDNYVSSVLNHALRALIHQIQLDLLVASDTAEPNQETVDELSERIGADFGRQLPAIRAILVSDLRAAYDGDPAAKSFPEILLGYPGMTATVYHRIAHALFGLGAPLCARLIASIAHSKTAIDLHPAARIGSSFFIDHGTGIVVGETAVIGDRVTLYQAVTLGAKNFPAGDTGVAVKGLPRHPIVEDDVVIYAGATILGRVTIGRGSVIGGNVWLTGSVSAGSRISQARPQNG